MKFTHTISLTASANAAWAALQDPVALMRCLPGMEDVQPEGDRYKVNLVTGLGPVRLRFQGHAGLQFDQKHRRIQADVTMSDIRSGNVHGRFSLTVAAPGTGDVVDSGPSMLALEADVAIGGKLGEFAQPLLKRKADQVVKEFADKVQGLIG